MEEVATCPNCKNQTWMIYRDRVKCCSCKQFSYRFDYGEIGILKAENLMHSINAKVKDE